MTTGRGRGSSHSHCGRSPLLASGAFKPKQYSVGPRQVALEIDSLVEASRLPAMRFPAVAFTLLALLASACGGSEETSDQSAPSSGSIESLWRAPGEDVGLIQGTSDYAPGRNRVSFLVVRGDGQVVARPRARVWLAKTREAKPFVETTASLEPIGVPGGAENDNEVKNLYVATVSAPKAGKYWLLAEPIGGEPIQALGNLVVKARTSSPPVGARAIASKTPTLMSTGGELEELSTASKPVPALYRYSVAETLAARKPFVVTFATPKFCSSRTCGPTVDVVDHVRRQASRAPDVRFIHAEIFRDNDPNNGVNRWVTEWKLPSEPWVFVVGSDGRIKAKFEGSVSVAELRAAVARIA
jgi:hypothetical protein